jgi:hypothetical protein
MMHMMHMHVVTVMMNQDSSFNRKRQYKNTKTTINTLTLGDVYDSTGTSHDNFGKFHNQLTLLLLMLEPYRTCIM